ncbi:unnamed protein product [Cercospora beticola]|nr:unnamed protein product [Cercospora beticola]
MLTDITGVMPYGRSPDTSCHRSFMPLQHLSEGKAESDVVKPGSQVKVKAGKKAVIRPSHGYSMRALWQWSGFRGSQGESQHSLHCLAAMTPTFYVCLTCSVYTRLYAV